jgi:hypothetical protein
MEQFILEEINKPKSLRIPNEAFLKQVILKEKLGILFGIKESLLGGSPTRITISVSMYPKWQIFRIIQLEDKITDLIHKIPREKLVAEKNKNLIDYLQLHSLLNIRKVQLLNSPSNLSVKYEKISPYNGNFLKNIFDTLFSTTDRNRNKLNILDAYAITKGYLEVAEFYINIIPDDDMVHTNYRHTSVWYALYLEFMHKLKVISGLIQVYLSYDMAALFLQFPFNHLYNNNLDFLLNQESDYFPSLYQLLTMGKPHVYLVQICTLDELERKMKLIHELLLSIDNR